MLLIILLLPGLLRFTRSIFLDAYQRNAFCIKSTFKNNMTFLKKEIYRFINAQLLFILLLQTEELWFPNSST